MRGCAALVAALLLTGCGAADTPYRREFFAFGTLVELTLRGLAETPAHAAVAAVQAECARLDAAWSPWGEGELGRLNAALATGGAAPVSAELAALIERARGLEQRSRGRFNPAIGRLVRLWGFDADDPPGPPPAPAAIAALVRARPSLAQLVVEDGQARGAVRAVAVDLGAIGKGYAAERAAAILEQHGVRAALIAIGGDVKALGHAGKRPWRVAIRGPQGTLIAAVELAPGEAVSTSGDYERYFEHRGRRYHHLLDPATGHPAGGVRAVSVVAADAVLADAAATALFVAGPRGWRRVARELGVDVALVLGADGALARTPAAEARVQPLGGAPGGTRE